MNIHGTLTGRISCSATEKQTVSAPPQQGDPDLTSDFSPIEERIIEVVGAPTFKIMRRRRYEVNTDPLRRCYNGCHFSSELVWGPWESLDLGVPPEKVEDKLKFWRELNDDAIKYRGESARCEFKAVEE